MFALDFGKWKYIKNACEKLRGINIVSNKINKDSFSISLLTFILKDAKIS